MREKPCTKLLRTSKGGLLASGVIASMLDFLKFPRIMKVPLALFILILISICYHLNMCMIPSFVSGLRQGSLGYVVICVVYSQYLSIIDFKPNFCDL